MTEHTQLPGFCENTVIGLKPFSQKFKYLFDKMDVHTYLPGFCVNDAIGLDPFYKFCLLILKTGRLTKIKNLTIYNIIRCFSG